MLSQIRRLINEKNFSSAAILLEQAFEVAQNNSYDDNYNLGLMCREIGKRDLAYKFIKIAYLENSSSEKLAWEYGISSLDVSYFVDAVNIFKSLTEKFPSKNIYWCFYISATIDLINISDEYKEITYKIINDAIDNTEINRELLAQVLRFSINFPEFSEYIMHKIFSKIDFLQESEKIILNIYLKIREGISWASINDLSLSSDIIEYIENLSNNYQHADLVLNFCRSVFTDPIVSDVNFSLYTMKVFEKLSNILLCKTGKSTIDEKINYALSGVSNFLNLNYTKAKSLIVVQTSSQYFSSFEVWYELFAKLNLDYRLLIVALDGQAVTLITEKYPWLGARIFLVPVFPTTNHIYGNSNNVIFYWYIKLLIIRRIVEAGFSIIQSDVDAFWKKDIASIFDYEFDNFDVDIVAQQEIGLPRAIAKLWGFCLCAGFWGLKSSEKAIALLAELEKYTLAMWDDQVGLNKLLLDGGANWSGNELGRRYCEIDIENFDQKVKVVALPEDVASRTIWLLPEPNIAVVHGQYYKHEEWVRTTLFGKVANFSTLQWKSFEASHYLNLAESLLQNKYFGEAAKLFKSILEVIKDGIDIYHKIGIAEFCHGNPAEAKSFFQKVLDADPRHLHAVMWLGISYMQLNDFDNAIKCFDKAIEIDPNHQNAFDQKEIAVAKKVALSQQVEL